MPFDVFTVHSTGDDGAVGGEENDFRDGIYAVEVGGYMVGVGNLLPAGAAP